MENNSANQFNAVLLDFDGTIFDTAPDLIGAINELLVKLNVDPIKLSDYRQFSGHGSKYLLSKIIEKNNIEIDLVQLTNQLVNLYNNRLTCLTKPFPGVLKTLKELTDSGIKIGIVTNKPRLSTYSIITHYRLENYFNAIICGDEVSNKKPHPEQLILALNIMKCSTNQSVMVGDTKTDIDAARAAHIPIIAVQYGYSPLPVIELKPDLVINQFNELPKALRLLTTQLKAKI